MSTPGPAPVETTFRAEPGLELFYRVWSPENARGPLVFVHGFGEHSGLYAEVAGYCAARGHAVYALDQRGHGRSSGARGHVESWDDFRRDLDAFLARIRADRGPRPAVLVGNSLGAAVVLDYALHHPEHLRGVVASSAPLGEVGVPLWLRAVGQVLARVWPRFALDARLDLTNLSRDLVAARAIVEDPLFHQRGTARLMTAFNGVKADILARAGTFRLPVLLLHGSEDTIAAPAGSQRFFEAAGSVDKQRKEYPGARHNLLHESNRHDVFRDLEGWVAAHPPPA